MAERLDLEVSRRILNVTASHSDYVRSEAAKQGISKDELRMLGQKGLRAVILSPGDLGSLLETFEMKDAWTNENIEGLADYLDEHLPGSVDEKLSVPTFPFGLHVPASGKYASRAFFTLAAGDPVLAQERAAAKLLTEEFFGLEGEDTSEAWGELDFGGEPWFARVSSRGKTAEVGERFASVLTDCQPKFPIFTEFDLLDIDVRVGDGASISH
ncbi:MAG TPA: hypothetical protein VG604_01950 [Candidatus Saccharimonadales bacterium]|nr:hypothetical protein [Candidatus Saccharimonadales bacterium]